MSITVLSYALSFGHIRTIFSNKVAMFIGKISFSLYLVHLPCLMVINKYLYYPNYMKLFLGLSLSLFISYFVFLIVEIPLRRFGRNLAALVVASYSNSGKEELSG